MRKKLIKLLSFSLISVLFVSNFSGVLYAKNNYEFDQETVNASTERKNIKYIEGQPGDTYLVYTYKEDGNQYKVVESANESFTEVQSTTYKLDSKGKYAEYSTLDLETKNNSLSITVNENNGDVYTDVIDQNDMIEQTDIQLDSLYLPDTQMNEISGDSTNVITLLSTPSLSAWHSTTWTGNTYIRNLTVTAIIASLTYVVTGGVGIVAGAIITGTSAAASTLFALKASYYYWKKTQYWRTLADNVFVTVEEDTLMSCWSDSARTNYIGYSRYKWSAY